MQDIRQFSSSSGLQVITNDALQQKNVKFATVIYMVFGSALLSSETRIFLYLLELEYEGIIFL